ncbi:MAG: hypothetical protein V4592_04860 [Bacteroidota bacterium]
MKSRTVYWILFPALAILFMALYGIRHQTLAGLGQLIIINFAFFALQLLAVSVWFSIRHKAWVNITKGLLGWGDILFLGCLTCCFSPANFVLFYIGSLLIVLIIWLAGKQLLFKNKVHIPLAGLQSVILMVVLVTTWLKPGMNVMSDEWLIKALQP